MTINFLETWHRCFIDGGIEDLPSLIDKDAVFHSPVVHSPQRGGKLVIAYLAAAHAVLKTAQFEYTRKVVGDKEVVLEFVTEIDGIEINGVDIITWNGEGKITDFKVMIRPLKAINIVHQKMAEQLKFLAETANS